MHPTVVIVIGDMWRAARLLPALRLHCPDSKLFVWGPLDSLTIDPKLLPALSHADSIIFFTDAQREAYCLQAGNWMCPSVSTLGLGLNADTFSAPQHILDLRGRNELKQLVFGPQISAGDFIVLNANSNLTRKRIDLTVEAFARFSLGKPASVKLCLHMRADGVSAWNLHRLCMKFGVRDRVVTPQLPKANHLLTDGDLALLYAACDVGINTSVAEGWGLVAFEHAAAGGAQIVPNHTACAELWRQHALRVPACRGTPTNVLGYEEHEVSAAQAALSLEQLYRDESFRLELATSGHRYAVSETFSWAGVASRLRRLMHP